MSVTTSSDSMGHSSQQDPESSWPDDRHQHRSPDRLIKDAEELEEQATSLRQLALRRRSLDMNAQAPQHQLTQQQISQQQLPQQQLSHQQMSQQDHMMHFAQPSVPDQMTFGAYPSEPSYTPYYFHSFTMYRPDGTLETGSTPGIEDYGMWDISTHQQPHWQIEYTGATEGSVSSGISVESGLEGMSKFVAHGVLQLPSEGLLQRYTKIFVSSALSGILHIQADMGGGLSPRRSGALQFFIMQALGIVLEDGVQHVYRRFFKQILGKHASLVEKVVGYAWVLVSILWTSPVWVYPALLNMRKEDALLSLEAC
ncbi:hypothetical protein B0A55_11829 [Friedmanniomyces simplex]|uniref:Wax synthase domain-containing protein n=1 Tax=Friedmanniomyces simplex TaxID=329884 RepID=A0A4U0WF23_9PEZI|nr:hypothetical protein B0A55_11829 [Friedmanniomyces simplex]